MDTILFKVDRLQANLLLALARMNGVVISYVHESEYKDESDIDPGRKISLSDLKKYEDYSWNNDIIKAFNDVKTATIFAERLELSQEEKFAISLAKVNVKKSYDLYQEAIKSYPSESAARVEREIATEQYKIILEEVQGVLDYHKELNNRNQQIHTAYLKERSEYTKYKNNILLGEK